ncbi:MAG: TetR family transcriptional regulator [Robiginitomaculum sp.]|nr:MAG: TetR family transcriptional regulator [Robiginitomaculum sp.]
MGTRAKLLELAQDQMQRKGYNGFSYADLAADLGVCKATIHHHFPTKADLGRTVIAQYRAGFTAALADIDENHISAQQRLQSYIMLFRDTLEKKHKICLAVMLAAGIESLPESVKEELTLFFQVNDLWLTDTLQAGKTNGEFVFSSSAAEAAKMIFSALSGAMVVAQSIGDPDRLHTVGDWLATFLSPNQTLEPSSPQQNKA